MTEHMVAANEAAIRNLAARQDSADQSRAACNCGWRGTWHTHWRTAHHDEKTHSRTCRPDGGTK